MKKIDDLVSIRFLDVDDEIESIEDFKFKQTEYEEEFLIWNISKDFKNELKLEKENFVLSEKGYYYWFNFNLNKILIVNFI